MNRTLIVGATSAIAAELAHTLAARGDRLFLLARSPDKLDRLVESLGSAVVGAEAGDFLDTAAASARIERATASLGGLDVAIFAHGFLGAQKDTEEDFEAAETVLETNLSSVVALLIPVANHMEAAGAGRIAVITSVAADRGRPRNYTYGAAKGALNVYLQGLRSRLFPSGVKVLTVRLGPTDTPMTVDHPKNPLFAQPDRVARDILRAVERGASEVYVPWYWGPIMGVVRNLPERLFQRFPFLAGR